MRVLCIACGQDHVIHKICQHVVTNGRLQPQLCEYCVYGVKHIIQIRNVRKIDSSKINKQTDSNKGAFESENDDGTKLELLELKWILGN